MIGRAASALRPAAARPSDGHRRAPAETETENGSRSERGTRTAVLFYSLIESAKLCSVEPRAYLREATLRAVRSPGTVTLARELKSSES